MSTDRRLAWAAAALAFTVGALAFPNPAGASSIDGQWHLTEPVVGPWEPPRTAQEPGSRRHKPPPAGLDSLSFPHFTGPEFNELFTTAELPNLSSVSAAPTITDGGDIDEAIRVRAEDRGYQRRPLPDDYSLLRVIDSGIRLQSRAAEAWLAMADDAAEHGLELKLKSAYRGHRYQRQVFLRPLATPYEIDDFAKRMKLSAPPGYSKHHTGYAADIGQEGFSDNEFGSSPAYAWLAADNFANAKKHGWIPSYPPDGGRQGPVPEAWEFTYVGVEAILCFHQPPTSDDPLCGA